MISISRLSVSEAQQLIAGAHQHAEQINTPMCIAISDESGNLIAFERMDNSKPHCIHIAQAKAYTSGSSRLPTHIMNANSQSDPLLLGLHCADNGRLCLIAGGLPVVLNGQHVGAIGVSAGSPEQDIACAQAGIDYLLQATS